MSSTPTVQTKTKYIKMLARQILEESKSLVAIKESIYGVFVRDVQELLSVPTEDSFSAADQRISFERELSLKTFFGTVNYCFINPYNATEYQYISRLDGIVKRSIGFYTALAESPIEWEKTESILSLTRASWYEIIQCDDESQFYDLNRRLDRLKQFAVVLMNNGITSISDFILKVRSADDLLALLLNSALFEDEFLKRAQVAIASLNACLEKHEHISLRGINGLTMMADYRLPQLLYNYGVIRLGDDLLKRLLNHEVIQPGSIYEKALRASVLVIGERTAFDLHINEYRLDKLLWEMSQSRLKTGIMTIPSMIVPTDKY